MKSKARLLAWVAILLLGGPYAMAFDAADLTRDALLQRFRDAAELAKLCDECRRLTIEMDQRSRALEHTETQTTVELDKQGQATLAEKGVERVWFAGDDEFRQSVSKVDGVTGKPKKFDPKPRKSPKSDTVYPLSRQEEPGMYRYELDQVEMLDDQAAIRVRFEPQGAPDGKLRGSVVIAPETGQCLRFEGEAVTLPRFVSSIKMSLEFGMAENGEIQTRRSVIDTAGGIGLLQKRFQIETVLNNYRVREDSN